jgi:predicted nucleic acid-binding protein
VIDTNIYIDFFNTGQFADLLFRTKYPTVIHLSAIVLMELRAGAFTHTDIKIIQELAGIYRKNGRLLIPGVPDFMSAGHVLARLQKEQGYELNKMASITNDVLVAVSARRIGATVVMQNRRDFEAINRVKNFSLLVI